MNSIFVSVIQHEVARFINRHHFQLRLAFNIVRHFLHEWLRLVLSGAAVMVCRLGLVWRVCRHSHLSASFETLRSGLLRLGFGELALSLFTMHSVSNIIGLRSATFARRVHLLYSQRLTNSSSLFRPYGLHGTSLTRRPSTNR